MASLPFISTPFSVKGRMVTPNDYLSKFGAVSMGPLRLSRDEHRESYKAPLPKRADCGGTFIYDPRTGTPRPATISPGSSDRRREAYECDITYGTNNEYGFDYLRDNLTHDKDELARDLLSPS